MINSIRLQHKFDLRNEGALIKHSQQKLAWELIYWFSNSRRDASLRFPRCLLFRLISFRAEIRLQQKILYSSFLCSPGNVFIAGKCLKEQAAEAEEKAKWIENLQREKLWSKGRKLQLYNFFLRRATFCDSSLCFVILKFCFFFCCRLAEASEPLRKLPLSISKTTETRFAKWMFIVDLRERFF